MRININQLSYKELERAMGSSDMEIGITRRGVAVMEVSEIKKRSRENGEKPVKITIERIAW